MTQQTSHEKRMSQRIPITLNIQVYAYGMLVASGVGVEMSEHGLLIRIEQSYSDDDELDPGKNLDVMLENCQPDLVDRWYPIKVVRKWEAGIAARFVGVEECMRMH